MVSTNKIVENALRWVTTEGGHKVAFDERGNVAAGNPKVTRLMKSGSVESADSHQRRANWLKKQEDSIAAKRKELAMRKGKIDKRLGELKKHDAAYWRAQKDALKRKYDGSGGLSEAERAFLHG